MQRSNHPNGSSNRNNRSIIDNSSPIIVVQETPISLSDEKLKRVLSETYEAAIKDANTFKIYKIHGILLSIFFSLLLALLTSTFNPIGNIDANTIRQIISFICIFCGVFGFIFLIFAAHKKMNYDTSARDETTNRIFNQNFTK